MKRIVLHFIFSALLISLVSCDEFLKEEPYSIVAPTSFFNTRSDFNSAVIGAYTLLMTPQMYSWYYPNTLVGLTYETRIPTTFVEYTLGIDAAYTYTQTIWTGFYAVINQCNLTLEKLSAAKIDEDTKKTLQGELLFLRGMVYFDLNRLYGGVPLHLKPTETIEDYLFPDRL